jgi:hypothetical protein
MTTHPRMRLTHSGASCEVVESVGRDESTVQYGSNAIAVLCSHSNPFSRGLKQ